MKKVLMSAGIFLLFLTSCGDSQLNQKIDLENCEGLFWVGGDQEEGISYYTALRIDSVIDDITPLNPDALLPDVKLVKICFTSDKTDFDNETELDEMNMYVYNTKTKKEYKPTLRKDESKFTSFESFIIVDVPKDTKVEDLSVGISVDGNKDYKSFLPLKNGSEKIEKNKVVVLDSVTTDQSFLYGGTTQITLKQITYNFEDAKSKEINELFKIARIAKVDVEYKVLDGDEADLSQMNYIFTPFRAAMSDEQSDENLGWSLKGAGTVKKCSYYFRLYPGETLDYLVNSTTEPSIFFKVNPNAK